MKQLFLLAAGLFGLCTLGLTSAKAGPGYYDNRGGDDCDYRRPVYHERYSNDCDDYRPRRRVVVREYYERPYYNDNCERPRRHRRHRVNVDFFLPVPPPLF